MESAAALEENLWRKRVGRTREEEEDIWNRDRDLERRERGAQDKKSRWAMRGSEEERLH